jgi:CRISPR-associated Csx11 family protein
MSYDLKILADNRNALLLAEVGAWLHMLGKFHEEFLKGNHELDIQIPSDLKQDYLVLDSLLCDLWPGRIWDTMDVSDFEATNLNLYDLIKGHRNPRSGKGLVRLMADAHGRGSSVEKGVLERFAYGQTIKVYQATAMGNETSHIDLNNLQNKRKDLYKFLQTQLQHLRGADANVNWTDFRKILTQWLEQDFRISVAETRRPLNDVTMFDQTIASVAFFKAALAQNLLAGWKDPKQDKVTHKYYWRLLRVGLNGPTYWGQAARVNDLLSRKAQIEPALNAVQILLEEIYPLGAEVYRDENGSIFLMPDINGLLQSVINGQPLTEHLQQIAENVFTGEARFELELSERTRNMLIFGQLAIASLPQPTSQPSQVQIWWDGVEGRDICPVCNLRPQGPGKKAVERKICDTCETRRSDRARIWTSKLTTTVWTDEVADSNGRLALVVGQFGLESWLTGTVFNTVLSFSPEKRVLNDDHRTRKLKYEFNYKELCKQVSHALTTNGHFEPEKKGTPPSQLLSRLVLQDKRDRTTNRVVDFYDLQVSDADLGEGRSDRDPAILALAMMRQQPSFARLRRVWETTRRLWQEVLPTDENTNIVDSIAAQVIGSTGPRLEIKGSLAPADDRHQSPGPFHTYELRLGQTRLSVVWDPDHSRFITCDNLAYATQLLRKDVKTAITGKLTIEEPVGYGSQNKEWGTITVDQAQAINDEEGNPVTYTPAIPILAEPRTFMALVPANKALDVTQAIKEKYEREMGKVRNRLPLHLGVVYFHRRIPLRAALEAGRRMLERKQGSGGAGEQGSKWRVIKKPEKQSKPLPETVLYLADGTQQFKEWYAVVLSQGDRQLTWYVPAVMGDGATEDVWYPYVFLETDNDDSRVNGRQRAFKGLRPTANGAEACWLVHVADLEAQNQVYFTPATLDFEWLDTTGRRFEIAYDDQGQRRGRLSRPYLLDELKTLKDAWQIISDRGGGLTNNQIYALRDLIESKRAEWYAIPTDSRSDKTFHQFCREAILNAEWPLTGREKLLNPWPPLLQTNGATDPPTNRLTKSCCTLQAGQPANRLIDHLTNWAVSGLLADVIELYMSVMKAKPQRSQTEKETIDE